MKISHGVRNSLAASCGFAWCAKFHTVCEIVFHSVLLLVLQLLLFLISHVMRNFCIAMRKMLVVGFFPLVFFFASLIGLATYCQVWKRAMKCSKARILHVFELQLALPWISQNSPSFLACFND